MVALSWGRVSNKDIIIMQVSLTLLLLLAALEEVSSAFEH